MFNSKEANGMRFEPANNGTMPDEEDLAAAEVLQTRIADLNEQKDQLEAQLEMILPRLRRYEAALTALTGPAEPVKRERKPKPEKPAGAQAVRQKPSRVAPERLERIKALILEYAEDHEEFRQRDIREIAEPALSNSSMMATAFEQLRQEDENFIRFARQDGNSKYYRLTRETVELQREHVGDEHQ